MNAITIGAQNLVDNAQLDFTGATAIASELGWSVFKKDGDFRERFANSLYEIITSGQYKPNWIKNAEKGRLYVDRNLKSVNERQMFENANLLNSHDNFAHLWWSRLASYVRTNEVLEEITGRERWLQCEAASLQRENELLQGTQFEAEFASIEDCTLGYDIFTYRKIDKNSFYSPFYIEVKSCQSNSRQRFIISRNEWQFAGNNAKSWQLDFYPFGSDKAVIYTYEHLSPLMPIETTMGKWLSAEVLLPVSTI